MATSRRTRRRILPSLRAVILTALFVAIAGLGSLAYLVRTAHIPAPNEISRAQAAIFYYDDGVTELGRLGEANRVNTTLDKIPLEIGRAHV